MAKQNLYVDKEEDFLLWGLLSPHGGHRIAWEINKIFNYNLKRQDDILISKAKNEEELAFPYYTFGDEENGFRVELFRNKFFGEFYLKELKNFDFLLMVKEELEFFNETYFSNHLKKLTTLQSAIKIDIGKIKNIAQLTLE